MTEAAGATALRGSRGEPASRGYILAVAVAVVVGLVIVLAWMFNAQGADLEDLKSQVGYSQVPQASPMDPEICWVMGANAYASGRGPQMSQMLSKATTMTECVMQAQRGALGQDPDN